MRESVSLPASARILIGAIAGVVGTAAMTSAMLRLIDAYPRSERYPLPPREVVEAAQRRLGIAASAVDVTIAAHFAFGAAVGSALALVRPRPSAVAYAAGAVLVWAGSYLGLFPKLGLLTPATRHPARRNLLMVVAHLVWGSVAALTTRELMTARRTIFGGGELKDLPAASPRAGREFGA